MQPRLRMISVLTLIHWAVWELVLSFDSWVPCGVEERNVSLFKCRFEDWFTVASLRLIGEPPGRCYNRRVGMKKVAKRIFLKTFLDNARAQSDTEGVTLYGSPIRRSVLQEIKIFTHHWCVRSHWWSDLGHFWCNWASMCLLTRADNHLVQGGPLRAALRLIYVWQIGLSRLFVFSPCLTLFYLI